VDELGCMELGRRSAELLLFQVLTEREEKASVAIASNESLAKRTGSRQHMRSGAECSQAARVSVIRSAPELRGQQGPELLGELIHLLWADPLVGWLLQIPEHPRSATVIGQVRQPRDDVQVEVRKALSLGEEGAAWSGYA
jgi:hypothetical protein